VWGGEGGGKNADRKRGGKGKSCAADFAIAAERGAALQRGRRGGWGGVQGKEGRGEGKRGQRRLCYLLQGDRDEREREKRGGRGEILEGEEKGEGFQQRSGKVLSLKLTVGLKRGGGQGKEAKGRGGKKEKKGGGKGGGRGPMFQTEAVLKGREKGRGREKERKNLVGREKKNGGGRTARFVACPTVLPFA